MFDELVNDSGASWIYISWRRSYNNLFRIQNRIFKSVLVGNYSLAFSLQSLLFNSNSIFLISIREVTQIDILRRIAGVDGRIYLDFSERFELLQFLMKNFFSWVPNKLRRVLITKKDGSFFYINLASIADRCWQNVVKYSLSPSHEALFSYTNFGFRVYNNIFDLKKLILLNINDVKLSDQKRVMIFDFSSCCSKFNFSYLLNNILLTRNLKLIVFRFLKLGCYPDFVNISSHLNFTSLLANILFTEVDFSNYCFRFGYNLIFFLRPLDNEKYILKTLVNFLDKAGLSHNYESRLVGVTDGFGFLDWNFFVSLGFGGCCIPSFDNYQSFLRRIKRIINNSNYGAKIKSLKLFPVIQDWYYYNRFTNLEYLKVLLFFVKKRTFKIFNSESKQDRYSSKILINKCFNFNFGEIDLKLRDSFFITQHVSFWLDDLFILKDFNFHCIHCGVRMILDNFKF